MPLRAARDWLYWLVVATFVAAVTAYLGFQAAHLVKYPPPLVMKLLEGPAAVKAGEPAVFTLELDRRRSCPAEVDRFWVGKDEIIRLPSIPAGASPIGVSVVTYRIPTAGLDYNGNTYRLTPGAWVFVAQGQHYCDDQLLSTRTPPIQLQVE